MAMGVTGSLRLRERRGVAEPGYAERCAMTSREHVATDSRAGTPTLPCASCAAPKRVCRGKTPAKSALGCFDAVELASQQRQPVGWRCVACKWL